ncbi:MAG: DUF2156 domain-containing protein [Clostridia bacterium]|nr:DUF2156 domain-containing protein [Clostridia bacterium]
MSLHFKPLTLSAIQQLQPLLQQQNDRFCDWTVGAAYMWRDFFQNQYAIAADSVLFRSQGLDGQIYFSYPLGTDNAAPALALLEEHCATTGESLQFSTVSPDNTQQLLARYGRATVQPQRNFYDYLYFYDDLATFAGRRYSRQRNHIHQFTKKWPNWAYHTFTEKDIPAVRNFLDTMQQLKEANDPLSAMEQADFLACRESLEIFPALSMQGGFITVDGQIVAFSAGESVGDTLYVHIEKGDVRYGGVYQLMVREFAAHQAHPTLKYINREDDTGDEGLRRSKLSYRPCALLEKNIVIPHTTERSI